EGGDFSRRTPTAAIQGRDSLLRHSGLAQAGVTGLVTKHLSWISECAADERRLRASLRQSPAACASVDLHEQETIAKAIFGKTIRQEPNTIHDGGPQIRGAWYEDDRSGTSVTMKSYGRVSDEQPEGSQGLGICPRPRRRIAAAQYDGADIGLRRH